MMNGWIKIHRDLSNHWIWTNSKYLRAWLSLLMDANHTDKSRLYKGQLVKIKRGESVGSLQSWSLKWKMTISQTRQFIKLLENDIMVSKETAQGFTKLTICNYDTYQSQSQENHKRTASKPQVNRILTATPKECKELKELKELKREPKSKQLSQIKNSFKELKNKFTNADVELEFDKFTDWMDSKGKTYKNYTAAFRNWLRRANAFEKRNISNNKSFNKTPTGLVKAYCTKCTGQLLFNKQPYPSATSDCCGADLSVDPVINNKAKGISGLA